jgi:hypothetical protein
LDEKLIQGQQQRLVVFIPRYQFASHILFSPASITPLQRTMSFVAQILQPGGGLLLIPFIRSVIMCLFMLTVTAFVAGVARIHMAILASLAGGLLLSISFFMGEYEKAMSASKVKGRTGAVNATAASAERAKTD